MTNTLTLRYIPVNEASLFNNNAKKHDLEAIAKSFKRYGFKSACKWESKLNNGDGGIVAGNGRVETLRMMFGRGDEAPEGIAIDSSGQWCVLVLFGVDAESEDVARAYAIDDNNLTLLCGEFTAVDLAKLYDSDLLLSELEALSEAGELPVTVDNDELKTLLAKMEEDNAISNYDWDSLDESENGGDSGDGGKQVILKFSIPSDKKDAVLAYLNVESENGKTLGNALIKLCEG